MLNCYLKNMSNLPNRSLYCLRCRKKTLSTNVQLHEQNRPKGGEGKQYIVKRNVYSMQQQTITICFWKHKFAAENRSRCSKNQLMFDKSGIQYYISGYQTYRTSTGFLFASLNLRTLILDLNA